MIDPARLLILPGTPTWIAVALHHRRLPDCQANGHQPQRRPLDPAASCRHCGLILPGIEDTGASTSNGG